MNKIPFDASGLPPERALNDPRRVQDRGAQEALALLAALTVPQLRAGLAKARQELDLLAADLEVDHQQLQQDIGHPGRHPSRGYEAWLQNNSQHRRSQLHSALQDVTEELQRRGEAV